MILKRKMSQGGGGQKSAKKVSRIIWMAPNDKILRIICSLALTKIAMFVFFLELIFFNKQILFFPFFQNFKFRIWFYGNYKTPYYYFSDILLYICKYWLKTNLSEQISFILYQSLQKVLNVKVVIQTLLFI